MKSLFESGNLGYNGGTILGRNLLTTDMLEYVKSETVESKDAAAIKRESIVSPSVLLGWQVQYLNFCVYIYYRLAFYGQKYHPFLPRLLIYCNK